MAYLDTCQDYGVLLEYNIYDESPALVGFHGQRLGRGPADGKIDFLGAS